jgi:hypothetical protein
MVACREEIAGNNDADANVGVVTAGVEPAAFLEAGLLDRE